MVELRGVLEGGGDRVEIAATTLRPARATFLHMVGGLRQTEPPDRVELLVRGLHHVSPEGDAAALPVLNQWLHPLRGLLRWETLNQALRALSRPACWSEVAGHVARHLVESGWARSPAPRAGGWWVARWNTAGRTHTLLHGIPAVSAHQRTELERSLGADGLGLFSHSAPDSWRWLEPEIAVRRAVNAAFVRRESGLVFRVLRMGGLTERWDLTVRVAGLARWGLGDLAAGLDVEDAAHEALLRYPDTPWTEQGLVDGIGVYLRNRRDALLGRSKLGTKTHGGFWVDLVDSLQLSTAGEDLQAAALAAVRTTLGVWSKACAVAEPPADSVARPLLEALAEAWRHDPPPKWPSPKLLDAWLDPRRLKHEERNLGELQSSRIDGALCSVFERRVVPFSETVYMAAVVSGQTWQELAIHLGFPNSDAPDARELNRYASSGWMFTRGASSMRLMGAVCERLWPAVAALYAMDGVELEAKIAAWMTGERVPRYLRNVWRAERHLGRVERLLRGGGTRPRRWAELCRMERIELTLHLGRLYDFHTAADPFDPAIGGPA